MFKILEVSSDGIRHLSVSFLRLSGDADEKDLSEVICLMDIRCRRMRSYQTNMECAYSSDDFVGF